MRFVNEYKYRNQFGCPRHCWTCIGRHGAVHFHVIDHGEDYAKKHGGRYSGGLEFHYRQPPDYMSNDAPSHEKCWLIGGACWHDGSSLYAQECVIPFWECDKNNHERMFKFLEREYSEKFNPAAVEDDA